MEHTIFIEFGDTDPAGIVYYPNYYRWMDASTHRLFHEMGFPTKKLAQQQQFTPLVETHCVFKQPAYYHQQLTVHTTVEFVKSKVFKLQHMFYEGSRLLASGYEIRAFVQKTDDAMKAVAMPAALQEQLTSHLAVVTAEI